MIVSIKLQSIPQPSFSSNWSFIASVPAQSGSVGHRGWDSVFEAVLDNQTVIERLDGLGVQRLVEQLEIVKRAFQ